MHCCCHHSSQHVCVDSYAVFVFSPSLLCTPCHTHMVLSTPHLFGLGYSWGLNLHKTVSECLICCEDCSDVDVLDLFLDPFTKSLDMG